MSNEKINNVSGVERELNRSNNSLMGSGGTSMEDALKSAFKDSADEDFSITIVRANSKKVSLEDPGNGELYVAGMPSLGVTDMDNSLGDTFSEKEKGSIEPKPSEKLLNNESTEDAIFINRPMIDSKKHLKISTSEDEIARARRKIEDKKC